MYVEALLKRKKVNVNLSFTVLYLCLVVEILAQISFVKCLIPEFKLLLSFFDNRVSLCSPGWYKTQVLLS